jgi:hypothetical protein
MIRSYEEEKLMANVEGLTGELVKANKFTADAVEETRIAHIKLKEKQDEFLQVRVRNEGEGLFFYVAAAALTFLQCSGG